MASQKVMVIITTLVVLLPLSAMGDDISPSVSQFYDKICEEVECGKGTCKANLSVPLSFTCECEDNWRRTRLDDEDHLKFLPCVIPNCSLDYSCQPAPPPVPAVEIPQNRSFFDPCYWIYCGEGTCTKTSSYKHECQCNAGYYNLLNVTAFPCYSDCTIGSDCGRLGIKVANSSSSTPGSQATSFLPGKFHWMVILMMSMAMVSWK